MPFKGSSTRPFNGFVKNLKMLLKDFSKAFYVRFKRPFRSLLSQCHALSHSQSMPCTFEGFEEAFERYLEVFNQR